MALKRIMNRFLRLLYPPRCVICHGLLPTDAEADGLCDCCAGHLPSVAPGKYRVLDETVSLCFSPFYYQDDMKQSIRRYKFCGRAHYHRIYGILLRAYLRDLDLAPPDAVTWAPLSKKRLRRRGYDQARLLAEEAASLYRLTAVPMLRKVRNTSPQSSLSAKARQKNAEGVYAPAVGSDITGKRVLLVDDIITTGSTLDACAQVLLHAGASEVVCLTLARSRLEQRGRDR